MELQEALQIYKIDYFEFPVKVMVDSKRRYSLEELKSFSTFTSLLTVKGVVDEEDNKYIFKAFL